jgi:hypothetical protein
VLEVVEQFEHIRRDQTKVCLLRWKSHCIDCGAAFEQISGMSTPPAARRCELHRGGPARSGANYPLATIDEAMAELRGGVLL